MVSNSYESTVASLYEPTVWCGNVCTHFPITTDQSQPIVKAHYPLYRNADMSQDYPKLDCPKSKCYVFLNVRLILCYISVNDSIAQII